jgi:hypothetical protein
MAFRTCGCNCNTDRVIARTVSIGSARLKAAESPDWGGSASRRQCDSGRPPASVVTAGDGAPFGGKASIVSADSAISYEPSTLVTPAARKASILRDDRITQHSDPADLHLDRVTGLHPKRRRLICSHAPGRAGGNNVAGLQLRERRAIFYQCRNIEAQVVDRGVLLLNPVQPADQMRLGDVPGSRSRARTPRICKSSYPE